MSPVLLTRITSVPHRTIAEVGNRFGEKETLMSLILIQTIAQDRTRPGSTWRVRRAVGWDDRL